MLGFKRFDHAAVTISGIELVQKIQKQQFKTGKFGGRSATMPELWCCAGRLILPLDYGYAPIILS